MEYRYRYQKSELLNDGNFNISDEYLSRITRQADLQPVGDSGYGKSEYYCPEGIPVETALFATLAAAGLSFGILFMAVTMITMPPMKRKRRKASSSTLEDIGSSVGGVISDLLWEGM